MSQASSIPARSRRASVPEPIGRVLVVMADRARRDRVRGALIAERFDTRGCSAVEDVMDRIEDFRPDIVLLDARATERSGGAPPSMMSWMRSPAARLIARLREDERSPSVILIATGAIEDDLLAKGLEAGALDFLSLSRNVELVSRVRVHVRERKDRQAFLEVREERDRLRESTLIDPVTGLPNRAAITDKLEHATSGGDPFAVLDDFRRQRDRFGHDAGDQILRAATDAVKGCARVGDHLGRYGEQELLLVAHGADRDVAAELAAQVHRQMEAIDLAALEGEPVTATVGVSIYDPTSGRGPAAIESLPDIVSPRSQRKMMAAPAEEPPSFLPPGVIYTPRDSTIVAISTPPARAPVFRTVPVPPPLRLPPPRLEPPPPVAIPPLPLPRIAPPPRRRPPAVAAAPSAPPVTRDVLPEIHGDLDGPRRHARVARTMTFLIALVMTAIGGATVLSQIFNARY